MNNICINSVDNACLKNIKKYNDFITANLFINNSNIHITFFNEIPEPFGNVRVTDNIILHEFWLIDTSEIKALTAELKTIFQTIQ